MEFEIITYDVWYNEENGFWVNDAFHTGEYVTITDDASDKEIIEGLKRMGYNLPDTTTIDGDNEFSLYLENLENEHGIEPLMELIRVH